LILTLLISLGEVVKYLFRLNGKDNIGSFYWVNNKRVVTMVTISYGPLDIQQYTGKLYAVNYDGSKAPPSLVGIPNVQGLDQQKH